MIFLAFLALGCSAGVNFGAYGSLLVAMQAKFNTSRASVSLPLSVCILVFCLLSPLVGFLFQRVSLRWIMAPGALVTAIAYLGMTRMHDILAVTVLYGLVGVGCSMFGTVAPYTIVSRYCQHDYGRAVGLMTAPVMLLLAPIATAFVLHRYGLQAAFMSMAAVFALLAPILLFVVDYPDGAEGSVSDPAGQTVDKAKHGSFLSDARFWLLILGVGLMTGMDTAFIVHTVPYLMLKGLPIERAALVLSSCAGAGILGSLAFGWLADGIGPIRALVINASLQAMLWLALVSVVTFIPLLLIGMSIGLCMPATSTLEAAAIRHLFGAESVAGAVGVGYTVKLPFLFFVAPLAGYAFDLTSSYDAAYVMMAIGLLLSALAYLAIGRRERRHGLQQAVRVSHAGAGVAGHIRDDSRNARA